MKTSLLMAVLSLAPITGLGATAHIVYKIGSFSVHGILVGTVELKDEKGTVTLLEGHPSYDPPIRTTDLPAGSYHVAGYWGRSVGKKTVQCQGDYNFKDGETYLVSLYDRQCGVKEIPGKAKKK